MMSEFDELHEHLKECVDSDYHTGITEDGVEFNIFEWAFGLSVKAKREHDALVELATKHAMRADELYELLEKQKSDIEKMLDQLFHHENVDAWLVCKMNDMLDDVNHQLGMSQIDAVSDSNDD